MNKACDICRGACCESMVLGLPAHDMGVWLRYHGEPIGTRHVEIAAPCRMLAAGRCSVWQDRPAVCRQYEVGGKACRDTVKRRRDNWREIFEAMNNHDEPRGEAALARSSGSMLFLQQ